MRTVKLLVVRFGGLFLINMAIFERDTFITADKLNEAIKQKEIRHSNGIYGFGISAYLRAGAVVHLTGEQRIESGINGTRVTATATARLIYNNITLASSSNWQEVTYTITQDGWYTLDAQGDQQTGQIQTEYNPPHYEYVTVIAISNIIVTNVVGKAAVQGEYIVAYDDPLKSADRLTGTELTSDILNSGMVTTVPTL